MLRSCSSLGSLLFQCFPFSPFCTEFALTCNEWHILVQRAVGYSDGFIFFCITFCSCNFRSVCLWLNRRRRCVRVCEGLVRIQIQVDDFGRFFFLIFFFLFLCASTICCAGVYLVDSFRIFPVFSMVSNLKFHLIWYITDRVECFSDYRNGFSGEIGEECYRHEEKNGSKSWRTHDVLQILHDKESVLSARIECEAWHDRCDELGKGYRHP